MLNGIIRNCQKKRSRGGSRNNDVGKAIMDILH